MVRRTKRQSEEHVIGREAVKIVTSALPSWWVVREYQPDYGIDLAIELFEETGGRCSGGKSRKQTYDTLGEHLLVQVKGSRGLELQELRVRPRLNVERNDKARAPTGPTTSETIRVYSKSIDTHELLTVQRMGAAMPVLLVLVDVSTCRSHFVCLTDYIDKVILPASPRYADKTHKTIYVPERNEITPGELVPLRYYGKRPKLYAAFQKFAYQEHEMEYVNDCDLLRVSRSFARILLRSDIWRSCGWWAPLSTGLKDLEALLGKGDPKVFKYRDLASAADAHKRTWSRVGDSGGTLYTQSQMSQIIEIRTLWQRLSNIGRIHEEICREWFLPTSLGLITS
jgi:hypothetical protein